MVNFDLDLCKELVDEMVSLQFSQASIDAVVNHPHFALAKGTNPALQRTHLTVLINHFFNCGQEVVPYQIRLGLSMAQDSIGWCTDMKLTLLPFLKENEQEFFSGAH